MERSTKRAWMAAMVLMAGLGARAQEPGFRLGDAAKPVSYDWHVAIDPREATFSGQVRIEIEVQRAMPVLWLNATDLKVESAQVQQEGNRVEATASAVGEDHLRVEPKGGAGFAPGRAVVTLRYSGPLDPVSTRGLFRQEEGGNWYVVSQFEAISARRAVPVLRRAGIQDAVACRDRRARGRSQVVSNTPEVSRRTSWTARAGSAMTSRRRSRLPSYLIALAVGPFDIVDGGTAGMNKHAASLHRAQGSRRRDALRARDDAQRSWSCSSSISGARIPSRSSMRSSIPQSVGFGAMENAGLITYASSIMLATPREETDRLPARICGHRGPRDRAQWFGDLVTLAWWDDIWLNEAFATWIDDEDHPAAAARMGQRPVGGRLRASAPSARTGSPPRAGSATRWWSKTDIEGAFDGITYQKGSAVISMFEGWFGPDKFREGVRGYLAKHAYGNATSDDFMRAIGESAGRGEEPLRMFRAFVEQPGVPLVDVALQCRGANAAVDTSVARFRPVGSTAGEIRWTTPVCFGLARDGKPATQCTELKNGAGHVPLAGAGLSRLAARQSRRPLALCAAL